MRASANPLLWLFKESTPPAEWRSNQARRIFEAAIEAEWSFDWTRHAVTGSVFLDILPPEGSIVSPVGTEPGEAAAKARRHIAKMRREADHLEATLAAYGGKAFVALPEQVPAPPHPFDAQTMIIALISRPRLRALWVHGIKFVRDASGAFVRANSSEENRT